LHNPRTGTLDLRDQLRLCRAERPQKQQLVVQLELPARVALTTAVTPVTVQRGSAARMPFLAAMDVPPPAENGKRGVGTDKCKLAPTAKRAQSSLDTNFPAFASAMANLTAQGTVDSALGWSHYTAAMSMVFTHGLEMPETG